jgi:hypothetical protein
MKRAWSLVSASLVFTLLFNSCTVPVEPPTIEYYITADESTNFDALNLTFDYTRAYQESTEVGVTAIRTVYLTEGQKLSLATDGMQEPIFLGASEIEPRKIYGYNFSFSTITVTKDGNIMEVRQKDYNESNKVEKEFNMSPGEVKIVTFVINTDESISMGTNNELKFLAKIQY